MELLIRNAQILLPEGEFLQGDVAIESGKITQVAPEIQTQGAGKIIDAQGLTLLPRVIDPQVNFRKPGLEIRKTYLPLASPAPREELLFSWRCPIPAL